MKNIFFVLLMMGAQFTSAEERGPQASVKDASPEVDDDPTFRVVTDPAGKPYFPKGRESFYTAYYRAANLPSLQSLRVDKGEVRFRAAFLPSSSKPLFLSYARAKGDGVISVARLSGRLSGSAQPGTVELQGAVRMKPEVAEAFEKLAAWPEVREPLKALDDRLLPLYKCLDGEQWILEVVTSEGYTMVDIQSPAYFEYHENEIRSYYEKEIRKDPQKYKLPDSFKKYDLPDLDVSVFATFCEDLLKAAEMTVPTSRGDEGPTYRAK
jgi:hypothetical protein